jgi:hypothetical protein
MRGRRRYSLGAVRRGESDAKEAYHWGSWILHTDERAAKLAPIIKALQAKGITSLTSRRRNPFDCAARVVASEAVVVKTVPPLERADNSLRRFVELRDVR